MSKDFTYLLRVRYSECDAQKVVFNAKYAEYVDIAATEYLRHIWGGYDEIVSSGYDFQVVNLNISWKSSATFDDVIAITVASGKIGNTSYTFALEMRDYHTRELRATAESVNVLVDPIKHQKMQIDEELRAKLASGAPNYVVDHAGV